MERRVNLTIAVIAISQIFFRCFVNRSDLAVGKEILVLGGPDTQVAWLNCRAMEILVLGGPDTQVAWLDYRVASGKPDRKLKREII